MGLVNQWIDLFRAGDYGDKGSYTPADLQQIADDYDPSFHEAPAVIGHPENDAPAYGWFDKLRVVGNVLQGSMRQADPAFEEAVKTGRFKKRSVALYRSAKGWTLRHVGFLGAQPPEIKGLADVKFEQEDKHAIEIEFAEGDGMAEALKDTDRKSIIDGVVEQVKALWHGKPAEPSGQKTFSEEEVKQIAAKAAADAIAPVQAKLDAQAKEFAETKQAQKTAATAGRAEAAVAKLKTAGRWIPAYDRMGLPVVFAELATLPEGAIEFGEGTAESPKKKTSALDLLVEFMEGLPKVVPAGNVYAEQGTRHKAVGSSRVNETSRTQADPNSIQLHAFAEKLVEEKNIPYSEALSKAIKQHPEFAQPGGAAAGAV